MTQKKKVAEAVSRLLEDKRLVRSYIKGKIGVDTLLKKGIRFERPI